MTINIWEKPSNYGYTWIIWDVASSCQFWSACRFENRLRKWLTTIASSSGWWFGCHFYIFAYIGCLIIPIDELIFFRGVALAHQPVMKMYRLLNSRVADWLTRPGSSSLTIRGMILEVLVWTCQKWELQTGPPQQGNWSTNRIFWLPRISRQTQMDTP